TEAQASARCSLRCRGSRRRAGLGEDLLEGLPERVARDLIITFGVGAEPAPVAMRFPQPARLGKNRLGQRDRALLVRSRDQQARWNGESAMAGRGVRRARAIGSGGRHAEATSWATRLFGVEPTDLDEAAFLATRTDARLLDRAGCGRSGRRVVGGLA